MSAQVTFTIAGAKAADFKKQITEEAEKRGMSASEYIVTAIVHYMMNGKKQ